MKDFGQMKLISTAAKGQPVLKVVAKIVTKEWPHGKGIMHDLLGCGTKVVNNSYFLFQF